ncbi:YetF domain-containing protein [Sporomusa aerivorans]|uniref:YetF domain-containing protein n=1 Tax=Sporomusa aerivorans TaxID=204936 RepID=UPI00352BBA88
MTDIIEYALRTVLAYVILLFVIRTLGRKEIAHATLFDFVSTATLGLLTVSTLVVQTVPFTAGLTILAIWGTCILTGNLITIRSQPARKFLEMDPVMVIHSGRILENNLKKSRYNVNCLLEQLKLNNIADLSQVEIGILTTDGELNLITRAALELPAAVMGNFTGKELIIDGQVIETALRRNGFTREWLQYELDKRAIASIADVALATITPTGRLYIDVKDDTPAKS